MSVLPSRDAREAIGPSAQFHVIRKKITENAAREQSQTAYTKQYDSMAARYEDLQARHDALQQQKERRQTQANAMDWNLRMGLAD